MKDLEYWKNFEGPWYGFDHVEVGRMHADEGHVGQHYALWMEEKGLTNWKDYFQKGIRYSEGRKDAYTKGDRRHWNLPEEFHYSTWTAERTIAAMEKAQAADQPFYVWSSFHDPHPPYIVPEPWASMYDPEDMKPGGQIPGEHDSNPEHFRFSGGEENDAFWTEALKNQGVIHGGGYQAGMDREELKKDMACYYGMVSFMDQQIGRILDYLDETGQAEHTLVVFTSDHGHFLGQHGLHAKAIHHYEDLLRVPFVVRRPGLVPAGEISHDLLNLVDLPRTFLEHAGLEVPVHYQGVDQHPSWQGKGSVRNWSITENRHGYTRFHMHSYVTDRYKLTVHRDSNDGELFDLQEDPGEIRNLWHTPEAAELKADLMHQFFRARMAEEPTHMPRVSGA